MLWSGVVLRNSNFGKDGTIDVLLGQKYKATALDRDYSKPVNEQLDSIKSVLGLEKNEGAFGGTALTCKCLVLSGPGNGYNSGCFALPQIGTRGLVAEIGDKYRFDNVFYVWLGGLYGNKQFGYNVELPNDDTVDDDLENSDKDKAYTADYGGINNDKKNEDTIEDSEYIKKGAFILKTKTNKIDDYDNIDSEKVDFKKILSENIVVLSQDKAVIRHNINDYEDKKDKIGIEQLFIDSSVINLKRKLKKDDKLLEQDLIMDNNQILISMTNEDGDAEITIKLGTDGNLKIETTGKTTVSSEGDVEISTEGDMKIKSEGEMKISSEGDMKISSDGKMTFEAKQQMQIKANGQDLGKQVDDLAQAVASLTTQGSPATQAVSPNTAAKATKVSTAMSSAFEG